MHIVDTEGGPDVCLPSWPFCNSYGQHQCIENHGYPSGVIFGNVIVHECIGMVIKIGLLPITNSP